MKHESNLRQAFVRAIRASHCMAVPIETGLTMLGVPDLFIRTTKVSAWAELKNMHWPIKLPFEVPFRPGQCAWLERHYELGGVSLLIVADPEAIYIFKNKNIMRTYKGPLHGICDFHFDTISGVNGRDFIRWLDNQ